jgi:ABC-type polysaccharide/polyol phosphate transport system ATPase subunit
VLWLDHGAIKAIGAAKDVVREYRVNRVTGH